MLTELKLESHQTVELKCDNLIAISIAKNPVHQSRTKHVEVDSYFISEKIEKGILKVNYIPSKSQVADIVTKALFLEDLVSKLNMIDISHPT